MWQIAKNSIVLFLRGKLFQHTGKAMAWILVGAVFTAAVLIGIYLGVAYLGLPLDNHLTVILAAAFAGFLGGMLQPYLFRDLKYQ
jgi:inner membrane protein involved in colicin E2 resistance